MWVRPRLRLDSTSRDDGVTLGPPWPSHVTERTLLRHHHLDPRSAKIRVLFQTEVEPFRLHAPMSNSHRNDRGPPPTLYPVLSIHPCCNPVKTSTNHCLEVHLERTNQMPPCWFSTLGVHQPEIKARRRRTFIGEWKRKISQKWHCCGYLSWGSVVELRSSLRSVSVK